MGQLGFHGIGRTHRIESVDGTGKIPWTVPLVLHGTGGIGRTHRIEGVDGTARIPWDCPTCPTWDIGFHGTPEGF